MIFEKEFNNNVTQVDRYTIEVKDRKSIHFKLLEGDFQHFFIVVKNPNNEIKAIFTFKTRIKSYYMSNDVNTYSNNSLCGELLDGSWKIEIVRTYPIIGGYKIEVTFDEKEECENLNCEDMYFNPLYQDTKKIYDERAAWYQGDLHLHSQFSDGRITLEDIDAECTYKDLNYISLTDHSVFTTKYPKTKYIVLPGTEITWDDHGHYNVWGYKGFLDYGRFISETNSKNEALDKMFKHIKDSGALLSYNHPFPRNWELVHNYDIQNVSNIEVINSPHLFDVEVDNDKAAEFFDYLWNHDILLYAVGGSDAHKKNYFERYPVGYPTTKVYCDGLSIENLLKGIREGHTYIQSWLEFEPLFYKENPKNLVLPGQFIEGEVIMEARCKESVTWELMKNGTLECTQYGKKFKSVVLIKENEYYRLQARKEGELVFFANPIHNKLRKEGKVMFQDLLQDFEANR